MLWGEMPAANRTAATGRCAAVRFVLTVVLAVGLGLTAGLFVGPAVAGESVLPRWKPSPIFGTKVPRPLLRPAALNKIAREFSGLRVLSAADAVRYERIFALQKVGDWRAADREIAGVENLVLMGHALYQRYMHPNAYRSKYEELRDWLADYRDHPGAGRVYRLALKRRPNGAEKPVPPTPVVDERQTSSATAPSRPSKSARRHAIADWKKGLGAWRQGDYRTALTRFAALAENQRVTDWTAAAGGFWAARAALASGAHQYVTDYLALAAAHPSTFYGLLASRLLGRTIEASWRAAPTDPAEAGRLKGLPSIRRAIALTEARQHQLADRELRLTIGGDTELAEHALLAAERLGLAATAIRLSRLTADANPSLAQLAAFPLPHWQPEGGFALDRALLYAFMRQESEFYARAKSPRGARGLMQLMPRTASYVGSDRSLNRHNRDKLFEPALNLALGQKYLQHLLVDPTVGGDLMLLAVAYNGGPGNLRKWRAKIDDGGDPLLFIETIPSRETRNFVERVLANFWIYRMRLGQATPSLDLVAGGSWSPYVSFDDGEPAAVPVRLAIE